MELYKFINEHRIERAINPLFVDGIAYSNPTSQTLKELGYKEIVGDENVPIKEGYYASPVYSEVKEGIIRTWELVKDDFEG